MGPAGRRPGGAPWARARPAGSARGHKAAGAKPGGMPPRPHAQPAARRPDCAPARSRSDPRRPLPLIRHVGPRAASGAVGVRRLRRGGRRDG